MLQETIAWPTSLTQLFEAHGASGWLSLEKTIRYIGSSHFVIADAKRGDIGNTANMYAEAFSRSWMLTQSHFRLTWATIL